MEVCVIAEATARSVLEVADSGPGIPPEERAHVFDRFYRVAGSGAPGSGLGLSIVQRVAEAHGASIELDDLRARRPAGPRALRLKCGLSLRLPRLGSVALPQQLPRL